MEKSVEASNTMKSICNSWLALISKSLQAAQSKLQKDNSDQPQNLCSENITNELLDIVSYFNFYFVSL